jgi:NAD(P)-dependent dehydrogenase (short-subunit alcohol dehydrogenase family)
MEFAQRVTHRPPPSVLRRLLGAMWRQSARSAVCPDEPRLDGKIALVSGGGRGVGLATSRGLAARGAEVIAASRGEDAGRQAAIEIEGAFHTPTHFVSLDLADLRRMPKTLDDIEATLAGRRIDILVENAGLWPTRHRLSAQGFEIAFATNVLGHHALACGAIERGLLSEDARVVIVTGDIYILSDSCSADYAYRGAIGGQLAYCRSKLGNLWFAQELARRHPRLRVHAVHPGVIASELGGTNAGLVGFIKRALMLSIDQGAETSIFCATQPNLPSGSYYHNVLGRVELDPKDPAADTTKARELWELVELCAEQSPEEHTKRSQ